jgi:hypothetical protein
MTSIDRQQAFSGTKEAAAALRLNVAQLERYLATQIAGFAGPPPSSNSKAASRTLPICWKPFATLRPAP